MRAAQARAIAARRSYVVPQDVKAIAAAVIGHRILLTTEAEVEGRRLADVIDAVLAEVPVPVEA